MAIKILLGIVVGSMAQFPFFHISHTSLEKQ